MALFKTRSAAVYGIDIHIIDVEVDLNASGTARDFVTVGMPDIAVRESRERIKSALFNSVFGFPSKVVTINLPPANLRKELAGFDLPIAMAMLGAMGMAQVPEDCLFAGELSLDGGVRAVTGVLPMAVSARRHGIRRVVVPRENAAEATVVDGVAVFKVAHLAEAVALLSDPRAATPVSAAETRAPEGESAGLSSTII